VVHAGNRSGDRPKQQAPHPLSLLCRRAPVPVVDLLDYHDGVRGVGGAAAAAEVADEEALWCRCGGHGEGLVLPRYVTAAEVGEGRARRRADSAARERTRRQSGGVGALGLELRRRRRATSGGTGAAGGAARRGMAGKKDAGLGRGRTRMVGPTGWDAR
jgi:hypothetical protein